MPNRKSDATPDGEPSPDATEPDAQTSPEAVSASGSSDEPLPAPGAESETPDPKPHTDEPQSIETVTVDAAPAAESTLVAEGVAHENTPVAAAHEEPAAVREDPSDESSDEDGGWSFAARALTLLLVLIAGAALGIWGAPKLVPLLPSGLAPVADWLEPGRKDTEAEIAALQTRVDEDLGTVNAQLADLSAGDDVDARIKAAVDAAETRVSADIGALQESVGQLDGAETRQRLDRLQSTVDGQGAELDTLKQQLSGANAASGQLSDEAAKKIDVYRAELDGVKAQVASLQDKVGALGARIDEVSANADKQIETAKAQATEVQTKAETARNAAELQSDVALIRAALASGQPFADPLQKLAADPDVKVPDGLSAAASTGVATMASLRDRFPDAAHAAIQSSILASAGDGVVARSKAFLAAQMASRSLTPQEGTSPDAVLSRMEEKLRNDDLDGALAEAAALPSEATAAMSGWLEAAKTRAAAVDGLAALDAAVPATN